MKIGDAIKYIVTWPRGEPKSETREGIIEGLDGDYHAPEWTYGRKDFYFHNGKYLVRCTSCSHHRIDSIHPSQITEVKSKAIQDLEREISDCQNLRANLCNLSKT